MRTAALALIAGAALADGDPPGTVALQLEVGETFSIVAPPGSNVLCDDLAVVAPEFRLDDKGFLLRAKAPGTTLCGVWLAEVKPGGLYRVVVAPAKDAPAKDQGSDGDAGAPEPLDGRSAPQGPSDAGAFPQPRPDSPPPAPAWSALPERCARGRPMAILARR